MNILNKNRTNIDYVQTLSVKLLLFFIVISLSACVSQKKKGDISKLGKAYHNTTAKYNGYFNANELVEFSIVKLKESHTDNFNQILPIYPEIEVDRPEAVAEDLNKAIEKVTLVATVHDPSHWVDDCYVLLGKAQFLKQDYETAEQAFEYFVEEFDPSNRDRRLKKKNKSASTKKKKSTKKSRRQKKRLKKKNAKARKKGKDREEEKSNVSKASENSISVDKSGSGIFKHDSAYPEGLLWLAKTCVKRDKYSYADYYLKKITEQANVSKDILNEIPVVHAFSAMEREDYTEAVKYLTEAIPLTKDKYRRARFLFIRSQLQQHLGNKQAAYDGFNEVIKLRPDFVMEFNAELNLLKNSNNVAKIESKLEDMLKEDKYNAFQDQIYYTLGEITYEKGSIKESIPYYQKSIKYNTQNEPQLVESYYKLANIFYSQEDFVMAKNYFDSTATEMPKLDPRYRMVDSYSKNLKDIAENILIIELQDSLLRISAMSDEEKEALAYALKKEEIDQKIADSKDSQTKSSGPGGMLTRVPAPTGVGGSQSTFFAYNESKKIKGKSDFDKQWGIRTLEDDWRRSAKSNDIAEIGSFASAKKVNLTPEEINDILRDVPSNPASVDAAKGKIRDALYLLGVLYREKIENYKKSIGSHEELQVRFPGSEKEPDAYYYLYLNHLELANQDKAQYYLNLLKSKYPEEKYTLSLTDPNYVNTFLRESKIQETMYDETYEFFNSGQYEEVIANQQEAEVQFGVDNTFAAKYALLGAMAAGKISGKDAYINELKTVVAKYPNTQEQARAKEILRFLKGDSEAFDVNDNEALENFTTDDDKIHYIIVVLFSDKDADLNASKISINNYNRKYHKVEKIRTSSNMLNTETGTQIILLRRWDDKDNVMKYFSEVMRNKTEFIENKVNYEVFAVTQKNYREIMKQRSINEYEAFFKDAYQ